VRIVIGRSDSLRAELQQALREALALDDAFELPQDGGASPPLATFAKKPPL
jgi:hypothetical protein